MVKYGMIIDLKRCIGCLSCALACKVENFTGPGVFWNTVEDEEIGSYPTVRRVFIPRACMHCRDAPCVSVCPTGSSHSQQDGLVLVDGDKCVGCQSCIAACPDGARYYIKENKGYFVDFKNTYDKLVDEKIGFKKHKPGIVEKCDFCADRLKQKLEPACVKVCPVMARIFGDLNDPHSEVSQLIRSKQGFQLHKDLGTGPSVYYISP